VYVLFKGKTSLSKPPLPEVVQSERESRDVTSIDLGDVSSVDLLDEQILREMEDEPPYVIFNRLASDVMSPVQCLKVLRWVINVLKIIIIYFTIIDSTIIKNEHTDQERVHEFANT